MSTDIRITSNATGKRLLIFTPYNVDFIADVQDIGGEWERDKRAWSVDRRDEDRARELVRLYFGTDGSPEDAAEFVTVRIHLANYELSYREGAKAQFAGRTIATRPGRDAPVRLAKGVVLVAGDLPFSGGSMKYPQIGAGPDVMVEVRDIPRSVLELYDGGYEIVREERANPGLSETERLRVQRDELLAQVRELDDLLRKLDPEGETRREEKTREELIGALTARLRQVHAREKSAAIREIVLDQQARDEERAAGEQRKRKEAQRLPLACRCSAHVCPPVGYTVTQYAKLRGVSTASVSAWCKKGKVPAVQHKGRWYVTTDDC
ncbi:hypothetical protein LKL35_36710 [Streptomyces sp. ET3-23]|uniref:helix-turn-helix domain-containing protein n=1 Tax=Streptomyces sp. ET3-23 TaxID=2885643 RepID=UPI001D0FDF91|nr:helix-turn-helix domain-containing protein [Streptomyces sp. ET3-23]MCC2280868.1 hypothetical protein [Streptomyces sp. ET3-23]